MNKGFLLFLFAASVLVGSPSVAEDLFLAPTCAPMSSATTPTLPEFLPAPESRVIVCGTCGDVACDFKRAYQGCNVSGTPGVCEPGPPCPGQTNVQCACL